MNQKILEALAAIRDIAANRLLIEICRLEVLAYDKQNTNSKTPPSDTGT